MRNRENMINENPQKIFQSLPLRTPNFLLTSLSTKTKTSETEWSEKEQRVAKSKGLERLHCWGHAVWDWGRGFKKKFNILKTAGLHGQSSSVEELAAHGGALGNTLFIALPWASVTQLESILFFKQHISKAIMCRRAWSPGQGTKNENPHIPLTVCRPSSEGQLEGLSGGSRFGVNTFLLTFLYRAAKQPATFYLPTSRAFLN